jgi:ribosomal protein L24E
MKARHDGDGKIFFERDGKIVWLCEVSIDDGNAVAKAMNLFAIEHTRNFHHKWTRNYSRSHSPNFTSIQLLLQNMKTHTCRDKFFIPTDDPSNDVIEATQENRMPTKFPTKGYTCVCGEDFRINCKDCNFDEVPQPFHELLTTDSGNQTLCTILSK